jgi:hypothetical protein
MKILASLVLSILSTAPTFVAGAPTTPRYFERAPITRLNLTSAEVQRELGALVSNTTVIFGPEDSRFAVATERWNRFAVPQIQVVIAPGQESDVPTIASSHGFYWYW